MKLSLTRIYRFSASHRLHAPELSAAENTRIFGKCNNPFGHGHDYVLSVTANGTETARTGMLFPRAELDSLVHDKILRLVSHKNLNLDVPQFASLVPTTENVVAVLAAILLENWAGYITTPGVRLSRVHIQETDRNGFEILLPAAGRDPIGKEIIESVTVHA